MKRRALLQAGLATAGATLLGVGDVVASPPKVTLVFSLVLQGPYEKLPEQLQEGIEGLEKTWPDLEPEGRVHFAPLNRNNDLWLMSDAWEGEDRTLHTEPDTIFKQRRWDVIKRAVWLRKHRYWHQEMALMLEPGSHQSLDWHQEQLEQLSIVHVWFHGLVTPHPRDVEAIKTPFTSKKLVGFKRIKS